MALPKKTKSSKDDVSKTKVVKKETLKERIEKDQAKKIKKETPKTPTDKISKNKTKTTKKSPLKKILHIIGLILLPTYFRNSWKELKLVAWPNLKLSRQLTTAVIIFAIFFGVSIYYLDNGLGDVFKIILLK